MAMVITDNQNYKDIANAIREKNGEEIQYKPNEMADAVRALSSLNFEIVGGITQPESPKENTIWINTDQDITGWVLSVGEPSAPIDGMVWITVSNSSQMDFNAVRENAIWICPISCQQYSDGQWVVKDIKIYKENKWCSAVINIVENGVTKSQYTWKTRSTYYNSSDTYGGNSTSVTQTSTGVKIAGSTTGYGMAYVTIDLTGNRTIKISGTFDVSGAYSSSFKLCVWSSLGTYITSNVVSSAQLSSTGATLDLSSLPSGTYLVGVTTLATNVLTVKSLTVY